MEITKPLAFMAGFVTASVLWFLLALEIAAEGHRQSEAYRQLFKSAAAETIACETEMESGYR